MPRRLQVRSPFRWAAALLLALAALGLPGLPSPTAAAAAAAPKPDPFFGSWYDGLSPQPAAARTDLDGVAAAGVGLVRQYVFWDRIETSPGTYDWSRFDQLVKDATARKLTILPTLLYTPAFYTSKPAGSTSTAQFPPADPQHLADFASAMVKRYGPKGSYWCTPPVLPGLPPTCTRPMVPIKAWEVWNEPNYTSWWKGAPSPTEYAALLVPVAKAIHAADPTAEVVLGAMANQAPLPGGYLDQLYDAGAGSAFDSLSINPYAFDVEQMTDFVRATRAVAARHGDAAKPIRVTEYGWATGGRSDLTVVDEPCQAALLHAATTRLAALRDQLGIRSVVQFQWEDPVTTGTAWPNFAGLHRADGTAKPALAAVAAAVAGQPAPAGAALVDGCPRERRTDGVYRDAVRDDGALAYLRLGDAAGATTAQDDRGAHPASYLGTPGLGADGALTHDVDPATTFSGDDTVAFARGALLLGQPAATVEAWVRTVVGHRQVVYQERPPTGAGLVRVDVSAPGAAGRVRLLFQEAVAGARVQSVVGTATVTDGAWHHIVVTRDSTAVVLYVDGAVDVSATLASARTTSTPPASTRVVLGRDVVHNRDGLMGDLDEVALYGGALSAAQVAAHWAAR